MAAGAWPASLALHDEASWQLPDWEAFSESGRSVWTDDARESDLDSDSDASAVRVPKAPPMASTTTVTASAARRRPLLPLEDLRALHMRFAQERQQATNDPEPHAVMRETQTQIASQLERVREELRAFQHEWHTARVNQEKEKEQETQEAATALVVVRETNATSTGTGETLQFDMAVQTDIASMNDDALRQWLHLITQKMEVLTTSFHGDTTQLPLRYPLQTHLERPVGFSSESRGDDTSVASWHVGGSLKTLVSESTAERLLDLERAVACLVTATRDTTTRYVAYFEGIVVQIQDLHQQRLRQVVDESLSEMKHQRTKYKKRIEQLEDECRTAKDEIAVWQQKAELAKDLNATDAERLESVMSARQQQLERERDELVASIEMLHREQAQETQVEALQAQLTEMATSLEVAQRHVEERDGIVRAKDDQIKQLQQQHRVEIERLETIHKQLRSEILDVQWDAERVLEKAVKRHEQDQRNALEAVATAHQREIDQLTKAYGNQIQEMERRLQEAEETKRLVPAVVSVDQQVQTDQPEDLLEDKGTTDERITRLKKRCKALESLLDKKFEDNSAGSVESSFSGRWSARPEHHGGRTQGDVSGDVAGSRTLPLTLSMESSLNDTYTSSHAFNTPSRDDLKRQMRQQEIWETLSNRSTGSSIGRPPASDPEAPSPAAMLALVRKLEALATSASTKLPTPSTMGGAKQPDEEPDLSAATTPTRSSRPTSASLKKSLSRSSTGLAGSHSAAVHSLKDPRRRLQQPQQSAKDGTTAAGGGPTSMSSSATSAKQAPSRQQSRTQQSRFSSR